MSGNRCPNREADALAFLKQHGPSSQSEVAAGLGVKPNTASHYLQMLRHDGLAWNTGVGCKAVWQSGPAPGKESPTETAIRQVASVWDYAQRMS